MDIRSLTFIAAVRGGNYKSKRARSEDLTRLLNELIIASYAMRAASNSRCRTSSLGR